VVFFPATAPPGGSVRLAVGMQREGYDSFGASTNTVTVNGTEPVNNPDAKRAGLHRCRHDA